MNLSLSDETGQSISFDQLIKHKENIQPLKQGRSVAQLHQIVDIAENKPMTGLSVVVSEDSAEEGPGPDPAKAVTGTSHQRALKRRIEESHLYFEEQLNTYTGSDIMAVWNDYVEEVQTSTYASSSRALVLPIIEAMINHICLTPDLLEQFRDDQRFLKHCYLLCESVTDPLRVYRFLQGKGIGQREAKFFLQYSHLLYVNHHFRSTIEVLYNAIKAKVEPTAHLKNRYKYIVECEKQRLGKILVEPVSDKKFQELVKAKDQQTIGKFYSFSYDATRDNILNKDGCGAAAAVGTSPDGTTIIQRGLSVIYKDGVRPPSPQKPSSNTHQTRPALNAPVKSAGATTATPGGIYMDSDDDTGGDGSSGGGGHQTDQRAAATMSPDIKRHARLATLHGKSKENQQPYTSDFSLAHDAEFIADLDEFNAARGIQARPLDTFELAPSQVTTGIYCDDDDDDDDE